MRRRVRIELGDAADRRRIADALRAAGLEVAEPGEAPGRSQAWIVEFPGVQGAGAARLRAAAGEARPPAVLALCRPGAVEYAVEALKEGADEFVLAPAELAELVLKTERALELCSLRANGRRASPRTPLPEVELAGSSAAIVRVREQVGRAASGRATVLLTGETGTGKELAATAIHRASQREEPRDLALPTLPAPAAAELPQDVVAAPLVRLPPEGVDLRDVERELLLQALERSGWVQKEAARLLRMSRRKLNYRIRLLGIRHPSWRRNRGFSPVRSDVD